MSASHEHVEYQRMSGILLLGKMQKQLGLHLQHLTYRVRRKHQKANVTITEDLKPIVGNFKVEMKVVS